MRLRIGRVGPCLGSKAHAQPTEPLDHHVFRVYYDDLCERHTLSLSLLDECGIHM